MKTVNASNANFTRNDLLKVALSYGQPGTEMHTGQEMAFYRKYLPAGYGKGKPSYYERHLLKAASESTRAANGATQGVSVILPDHFMHFALPDSDSKLFLSGIALQGQGAKAPRCESAWRKGMARVAVLQANFRLRGALAHWMDVSKDPSIFAARLNEPFHALSSLKSAFGEPQSAISVKEFSPDTVIMCNTLEPLIVANLAMQELLLAYSGKMDGA